MKFVKSERPAGQAPRPQPVITPAVASSPAKPAGPTRSAAAPPGPTKAALVPFDKEQFKNDPLIQKALEIFKGQIVEIRA